jgi:hypothetical protein
LHDIVEVHPIGERRIRISYDLHLLQLDDAELILAEAGVRSEKGFFGILHQSWVRFTEGNTLQHSKIVHQYCNKPPEIP